MALGLAIACAAGSGPGTAVVAQAPARDLFRITLLGTGNPRPSWERLGPSTLVEVGGLRLLIDAGRGASIRLFQLGSAPLVRGVDAVFFTHLHSCRRRKGRAGHGPRTNVMLTATLL